MNAEIEDYDNRSVIKRAVVVLHSAIKRVKALSDIP